MKSIQRAFLYVTRKKGKSFLLFGVLLVMATFVLIGISIYKASEATQRNLRESLGGTFTIVPEFSENNPYFKMEPYGSDVLLYTEMPLTKDIIDAVMDAGGIKSYDASSACLLDPGLELFPGTIPIDEDFRNLTNACITADSENNAYFTSGKLKLLEGRPIREGETGVALLSRDLAEKNNLKIGGRLTLACDAGAEVEIIGIFEVAEKSTMAESITSYDKMENKVFIDSATHGRLIPSQTIGYDSVVFRAEDPSQLDGILDRVRALSSVDWRAFTVKADNETYDGAAGPLQKLQDLMFMVLTGIIAVSAVILTLILTLWAKSRNHETGVLLALGIKKSGIIGQYLAELMLIAVFAFGLSYFTGGIIAERIGNGLLETQSMEQPVSQDEGGATVRFKEEARGTTVSDGSGEIKTVGAVSEPIKVEVGLMNMVWLYIIGAAVILFSVCISSIPVMRLKPREILSKMS